VAAAVNGGHVNKLLATCSSSKTPAAPGATRPGSPVGTAGRPPEMKRAADMLIGGSKAGRYYGAVIGPGTKVVPGGRAGDIGIVTGRPGVTGTTPTGATPTGVGG
jgi:hypothetical protein